MLFNVDCILGVKEIMSIDDCCYVYNLRADSIVNTFMPTRLTFFEVLDRIGQLLPIDFNDLIVIKKQFARIEFASKLIFLEHKMYRIFKREYRNEKVITDLNKYCLGKTEFITLLLANFSFTISALVLKIIKRVQK